MSILDYLNSQYQNRKKWAGQQKPLQFNTNDVDDWLKQVMYDRPKQVAMGTLMERNDWANNRSYLGGEPEYYGNPLENIFKNFLEAQKGNINPNYNFTEYLKQIGWKGM